MLHTSFRLLLTLLLLTSLNAESSLEDSEEFQRMIAEARKSNQAKEKARRLEREKEAQLKMGNVVEKDSIEYMELPKSKQPIKSQKEALLNMDKEGIKYFNYRGEQIESRVIDYIEIPVPHINKGHLEFMINYYNRDSGEGLSWKGGLAKLDCNAYTNDGRLLGSIKNKPVQSSGQMIYVKFTAFAGTLKCNLDFLGKIYHDSITFGGFNDLYSPTFSTEYKK